MKKEKIRLDDDDDDVGIDDEDEKEVRNGDNRHSLRRGLLDSLRRI